MKAGGPKPADIIKAIAKVADVVVNIAGIVAGRGGSPAIAEMGPVVEGIRDVQKLIAALEQSLAAMAVDEAADDRVVELMGQHVLELERRTFDLETDHQLANREIAMLRHAVRTGVYVEPSPAPLGTPVEDDRRTDSDDAIAPTWDKS